MLVFTPALCPPGRDPLEVLAAALPYIDAVQVRVKDAADPRAVAPAREVRDWAARVLELRGRSGAARLLVTVNDRVDAARALLELGLDGVHVGRDDCPPEVAREILGP